MACDPELLNLIIRGAIGGQAHPFGRLILIDDDGSDIDITTELKSMMVVIRRDDRRTDQGLLALPSGSIRATLRNDLKQFTPGASGAFDGKLRFGRKIKARLGYKVGADECVFEYGPYFLDDPSFNVAPAAEAFLEGRDLISLALDRQVSVRSLSSIQPNDYMKELLLKVGLEDAELDLPSTGITITFAATDAFSQENTLSLLSQVLLRLQTDDDFRLIQSAGKIKLVVVPSTGQAERVYHYKWDLKGTFSRRERSNQARSRTTIVSTTRPTVTEDSSLATFSGDGTDFTGSPPRKTLTLSSSRAIRIEWRQPDTDTLKIKETERTRATITFAAIDPAHVGDGSKTFTVTVRGDIITDGAVVAGEAGPGEDQGGAGLGNTLNALQLRRGRTIVQGLAKGFTVTDATAQSVANKAQQRLGGSVRELTFTLGHGDPRNDVNDLFRIVEKYSNDLRLYHVGEIRHSFRTVPVQFQTTIVGQFANITEIDQAYDKAFQYDVGRIYDERFGVGNEEEEDLTFRGAVVTRAR